MSGRIAALCISDAKGEVKRPVDRATFVANHGIEGDAHAGSWHRQVSLLAAEAVDEEIRPALPDVQAGDFAENLLLIGVDIDALGLGSRLRLGSDVELVITQIGKVCHTGCAIAQATGDCVMPRRGVFARVVCGGTAAAGDPADVLDVVPRETFQAVVLTLSDRCARGEATDTAGPTVARLLSDALGAHVYTTEVLPDDAATIQERLCHYADGHSIDLVLAVGGTGFAPRDVTPEATRAVVQRLTPGLDEAMRAASMAKTPHAMLSRAASGIRGATLIINLPGSERAARENLEAVLPALRHGLEKLRGDPSDCGRPATKS